MRPALPSSTRSASARTCGCACGRRPLRKGNGSSMFTGIVADVGRIERLEARGGDVRLVITCQKFDTARLSIGDSIAVQGCCLTAVQIEGRSFAADVSRETLALTTLADLKPGAAV